MTSAGGGYVAEKFGWRSAFFFAAVPGILFALLSDGRRVLGTTRETAVMEAIARDGFLGSAVTVGGDRSFEPASV